MAKRKHVSPEALDASLRPKQHKPIPHAFVLEAISTLSPYTRPMFGCLAIYVKDKIVLILRDKPKSTADNGVWLATTEEHHQSLRREFPNMRSIQVLGKRVTGWQVLPVDAPDFESAALRACELVLAGDARIGKIPGARTSKSGSKATGRSPKQIKTSKKHASTIDFDAVRKIGLTLPGVEESTAYGAPALKVRGKLLACVPTHSSAEPGSLAVRVGFDDRAELLAAAPDVYYVTDHYLGYSAVLVRLSRVTPDVLRKAVKLADDEILKAREEAPAREPRPDDDYLRVWMVFDELLNAYKGGDSSIEEMLLGTYERTLLAHGSFKNGERRVDKVSLSFHGDVTRKVFDEIFTGKSSAGSGFLHRCKLTYGVKKRVADWQPIDAENAVAAVRALSKTLATLPESRIGGNKRFVPEETNEAKRLREEFLRWLDQQI